MPDALLRFRILTAEEGGSQSEGFSRNGWFFGCPLLAPDGTYWDCRVLYGHQDLVSGVDYSFGISYLSPADAPEHLPEGAAVRLGTPSFAIGTGVIGTTQC